MQIAARIFSDYVWYMCLFQTYVSNVKIGICIIFVCVDSVSNLVIAFQILADITQCLGQGFGDCGVHLFRPCLVYACSQTNVKDNKLLNRHAHVFEMRT